MTEEREWLNGNMKPLRLSSEFMGGGWWKKRRVRKGNMREHITYSHTLMRAELV